MAIIHPDDDLSLDPASITTPQTPVTIDQLFDYETCPVDALPSPVATFIAEGAAALDCDPAYLLTPMVALLAGLIGNSIRLSLKSTWQEPAVVWSVLVGESGSMKSPAIDLVTGPVHRIQADLMHDYGDRMRAYMLAKSEHEEVMRAWAKEKTAARPEPPNAPVGQRILVNDITLEKVIQLLSENPRGLILSRDELSGFLLGFDQYKSRGGADLPAWLEVHRASAVTVDRKTSGSVHVPRAAVSILGGVQPGMLRQLLTRRFFDSGLVARFLFAMPPRRPKRWNTNQMDPYTLASYQNVVKGLRELPQQIDERGVPEPTIVELTADAGARWADYYNEHNRALVALSGARAAAWSKLECYAARLALVVHAVRAATGEAEIAILDEKSLEAGIRLVDWFKRETDRVYTLFGQDELTEIADEIRRRGKRISVRDWQNRGHHPTAALARDELQRLVDVGRARWAPQPKSTKGGRRSEVLVLCDDATEATKPAA